MLLVFLFDKKEIPWNVISLSLLQKKSFELIRQRQKQFLELSDLIMRLHHVLSSQRKYMIRLGKFCVKE